MGCLVRRLKSCSFLGTVFDQPQLAVGLVVGMLALGGCAVPGSAKYYKYSIDTTYNDRPYSYSEHIKCYKAIQPSEGPEGPLYVRQENTSGQLVAIALDPNHTLLFSTDINCNEPKKVDRQKAVAVLETGSRLAKVFIVRGKSKLPAISVDGIHVDGDESAPERLGPTDEQVTLTKSVVAEHKHQFENVTARFIPYEVWGASERSRNYFAQFSSVAIAKAGEAPPVSGWPEQFVQFKFYSDRAYQRIDGRVTGLRTRELTYRNGAFEVSDEVRDDVDTFYSAVEFDRPANTQSKAPVRYKGTELTVVSLQEIYDPETRDILLLRYSPAKDLAELLAVYPRMEPLSK